MRAFSNGDMRMIDSSMRAPNQVPGGPAGHGGWDTRPGADPRLNEHRTAAMRAVDRHQAQGVLNAAAADRLDRVMRESDPQALTARYLAAAGNEHYASAFSKLLRDPVMGHLRYGPEEVQAVRDMSYAQDANRIMASALETSSTGFPLPLTIDPSIIETGSGSLNPIRDLASVSVIGTHSWQGVSSDGVTAAYVAEGSEATDATPSLVAPGIATAQGRAFVQYTIEAGMDDPGLQGQLLKLINDARANLDASKFLTGTGTHEPSGILNVGSLNGLTTTQRVETGTMSAFSVGDPWLLSAAIPARFRANTTYAASPAMWDLAFRLVAEADPSEARQFDTGGRGGPFLGRPKVEWSTMATAIADNAKLIIGGDFATGYKIVDRLGMSAELVPHMTGTSGNLPNGTRGLYCYWRTGAGVVAVNALRYLEVLPTS